MSTITESELKELKDLILAFREDIKRLEIGQEGIREDIKKLENGQEGIREDIKTLEIGQAEIKGDIKALSAKFDGMDKRLEKVETSQKNQIWSLIIVLSGTLLGIATKVFFVPSNP
jgi:predicted  nucleic acid-binding Zn-ribbon protein